MSKSTRRNTPRLGANLKQARTARGLSLRALAVRAGCSLGNLSEVENGAVIPGAFVLMDLADAMGLTVDALLNGCHDPDQCDHSSRTIDFRTDQEQCRSCGLIVVPGRGLQRSHRRSRSTS